MWKERKAILFTNVYPVPYQRLSSHIYVHPVSYIWIGFSGNIPLLFSKSFFRISLVEAIW